MEERSWLYNDMVILRTGSVDADQYKNCWEGSSRLSGINVMSSVWGSLVWGSKNAPAESTLNTVLMYD